MPLCNFDNVLSNLKTFTYPGTCIGLESKHIIAKYTEKLQTSRSAAGVKSEVTLQLRILFPCFTSTVQISHSYAAQVAKAFLKFKTCLALVIP